MIQFTYRLTNMNTTHNEVTGTAVFRGPALREKAQKALNFLLPGKNSQELRDQDFWVLKNKQNLPVILNGLFLPNIPTGALPLTPPTPCKAPTNVYHLIPANWLSSMNHWPRVLLGQGSQPLLGSKALQAH